LFALNWYQPFFLDAAETFVGIDLWDSLQPRVAGVALDAWGKGLK
jgi:hypothetical protein